MPIQNIKTSIEVSPNSENWEVYIIQAKSGKFYTGITTNLKRRFEEHKKKRKGASFFHFSGPSAILFREFYPDRSSASIRESFIKKMSREEKLLLIKENKPK